MSFETELLEQTGTAADAWDIKAMVRRCWLFDFDGAPVRLWDGQGVLHAGGQQWLGTIDATGANRLTSPTVKDGRDGTSPKYTFGLPYLDRDTFDAIKADQSKVLGRDLTCWHVLVKVGEGLRPGVDLRFAYRLTMQRAEFADSRESDRRNLIAQVLCRSDEAGRSQAPRGTYSDTGQRERARILGVSNDDGCIFVASNANRTYTVGG